MRAYEMMLILKSQLEEEAMEAVLGRVNSIISDGNGEVAKVDKWGKRRLAYEIQGNTDGFYVVINFQADSDTTTELERILKITDEVVRYLLIRKDEE